MILKNTKRFWTISIKPIVGRGHKVLELLIRKMGLNHISNNDMSGKLIIQKNNW